MTTNPAESLKLECCDCHHAITIDSGDLENLVGYPIKVTNVNQFYEKLTCSSCTGKAIKVWDSTDRLLIDPEHFNECRHCGLPIEYPRTQVLPDTNICATCASDIAEGKPKLHQPEPIQFDAERIPEHLKKCPTCNKKTILRTNRRTNQRFIGCSRFPTCRWTASVQE